MTGRPPEAPPEIARLLDEFAKQERLHAKFGCYEAERDAARAALEKGIADAIRNACLATIEDVERGRL